MLGGWRVAGKITPARKIVSGKVVLLIGPDNLRVTLIEERKGTTRGANIHRLPEAVKNQNLIVE